MYQHFPSESETKKINISIKFLIVTCIAIQE